MINTINLNDIVRVKLNDLGRELFLEQYMHQGAATARYMLDLHTNAEGYTKFSLWDLMFIYGKHVHMGVKLPFEGTELIVETSNS